MAMVKHIKKPKENFEVIVDNLIFLFITFSLSLTIIFIFDIHHSFYNENIFPLKFIFTTSSPYIFGTFIGGIFGFLLIKFFLFALHKGTVKKIKMFLTLDKKRK